MREHKYRIALEIAFRATTLCQKIRWRQLLFTVSEEEEEQEKGLKGDGQSASATTARTTRHNASVKQVHGTPLENMGDSYFIFWFSSLKIV